VAGSTLYRCWLFVRQILSFEVGVAAGTTEIGMHGSRKLLPIHEERNRFAGSRRGHAFVAVAGETFFPRLLGFFLGPVNTTLRKQEKKNSGEEWHDNHSELSMPCLLRDHFRFNHI
jgi:hypothetical protein